MKVETTPLDGLLVIEPRVHRDERGFFAETWQSERYRAAGIEGHFVQDNHSRSQQGILRGLHFQLERPQGKLVCCASGRIFDVAVDVRKSSTTFGRWYGLELSDQNHKQLWVPPGFAHGFYVLSEVADVHYKCTEYYDRESERALLWSDTTLAIDWPLCEGVATILSEKDRVACTFADLECFP
ncbi:MAG: dTDP-4-dehydrorhamnose 3,5-epimerase [Spongiibacteraceae bacterium]|nr:dTDP-4-dehydrorhamnose 3,5-epimerase [Spongiibacteraceae bacterium]